MENRQTFKNINGVFPKEIKVVNWLVASSFF